MSNNTPVTPPERYRLIIDQVNERDREYFERHPFDEEYDRPFVPGETWPEVWIDADRVLVSQIGPGFRVRLPYWTGKGGAA